MSLCDFIDACEIGELEKAQHIFEKNPHYINEQDNIMIPCSRGHLEMVKWLYSVHKPDNLSIVMACLYACENNHLDIVQFICSEDKEKILSTLSLFEAACVRSQLETAKWLLTKIILDAIS